jgi:hypothetical protein
MTDLKAVRARASMATSKLAMRAWDLAHVHTLEGLDEGRDDHQPGLVRLAVLAEVLHDAHLALLDDVDHLPQRGDQDDHHERDDDQTD